MRVAVRWALGLLLLLGSAAMGGARADPADASLEPELRAWLSRITGLAVPQLPLRLTPEGDHTHLDLPIPGMSTPDGPGALTATVRPGEGGRWTVENIALPPSSRFPMRVPAPDDPRRTVPAEATLNLAGQDGRLRIDPSTSSPSTFEAHLRGVALDVEGGGQHQRQTIDRYDTMGTLSPAADGRFDLAEDATLGDWRIDAQPASAPPFTLAARSLRANGRLDGVNGARLAPVLAALLALNAAPRHDDAATRAALHQLVEALDQSVKSGRIDETFDTLRITAGALEARIATARLAVDAGAPDNRLAASLDIELAGLESPSLPPSLAPWLPRRIVLRPTLSGFSMADLTRLALVATGPRADDQALQAAEAALFAGPGATLAVDRIVIELDAARLDASGSVVLHSQDSFALHAHVAMTGFDRLIAAVQAEPALAGALPVLVMARGLARPDGDRLVWNIAGDETGGTVNGVDVSSLLGAAPDDSQSGTRR